MIRMPRGIKPFSLNDVRRVSASLSLIARETEAFLALLDATEFRGELKVDAGDAMESGIKHISNWLSKVQNAYRMSLLSGETDDQQPPAKPKKGRRPNTE